MGLLARSTTLRGHVRLAICAASATFLFTKVGYVGSKFESAAHGAFAVPPQYGQDRQAEVLSSAVAHAIGRESLSLHPTKQLGRAASWQVSPREARGGEESWLDCELVFNTAEARQRQLERLEEEMKQAADKQDYAKAGFIKTQIEQLGGASLAKAPPPEHWLLSSAEFPSFGRFLSSRGVAPSDVNIQCADGDAGSWGPRRCDECMRLTVGGPYGAVGVVSPAFPAQDQAVGCLGLSRSLDVDLSLYEGTREGALGDESFDASIAPKIAAFCRVG